MKNWRMGRDDISPPIHHDDLRQRFTRIKMGGFAAVIIPGPFIALPTDPNMSLKELLK